MRKRRRSGFGLADFALPLERGTLFHLKADGADRSRDHRGRGEPARGEVSVSGHFPFDHGLFGLQITFHRGILPDGKASFGGDVSSNGSVEDKIGGTVQISFDLDVA